MKKKVVIPVISAVFLLALFILGVLYFPRHYEKIALLKHVNFGMSPLEIRMIYGAPDETEESDLTPTITYTYHIEFEGNPATYKFSFIHVSQRYELYDVSIQINAKDNQVPMIYDKAIDQCRDEYKDNKGYYEVVSTSSCSLRTNYNAIIMSCDIMKKKDSVLVIFNLVY